MSTNCCLEPETFVVEDFADTGVPLVTPISMVKANTKVTMAINFFQRLFLHLFLLDSDSFN